MGNNSTDWHNLWQRSVWVDGKEIPVAIYRRQQRFEILSAPAQDLLMRLEKSKVSVPASTSFNKSWF